MDSMAAREKTTELDLEKGLTISEEEDQIKNPFSILKHKAQSLFSKFKGSFSINSNDTVSLAGDDASKSGNVDVEAMESMNKEEKKSKDIGKENNNNNKEVGKEYKSMGTKKAQKPPRPPKAPILDVANKRFIRELAELARLKRARVQKMRALKKMKASKKISSNTNIYVTILTIILCVIILYQGMQSRGTSLYFGKSEIGVGAMELFGNPSSGIPSQPNIRSPIMMKQEAGSDIVKKLRRFLWI